MANRTGVSPGDISYGLMKTMELLLTNILAPSVTVVGVVANGVSIAAFARLGLGDSVTVSYFLLTISDFAFTISNLIIIVSMMFVQTGGQWYVDPLSLTIVVYPVNRIFYDLSNTITCYIAIARCCCVALPLKFRSTFTRSRTFGIIGVMYIGFFVEFTPLFANQGLHEVFFPALNVSRVIVWFSKDRDQIVKIIFDSINRNSFLIITFLISVICLIIIFNGLRLSSKFRMSLKTQALPNEIDRVTDGKKNEQVKSSMSVLEIKVVQGVALVVLISVSCNFPMICMAYSRLAVPELELGRAYNNLYFLISNISSFIISVKNSFNWIVYYNYNTRYREAIRSLFLKKGGLK
ncbi:unnamed protein product [Lymnaea stagnalis]|uniref:G-protein coupled receptors family 1 profile domain-containing protein n=1 Tax=Lymnaea stagnalis TaxID=6523 RepID=A0AAV2GZW5_LYMST